jgi:hypothetical protein
MAFIAEAGILAWVGLRRRLDLRPTTTLPGIVGGVLVAYALVGYPLIGYAAGHRYPATATFGAPCPTTIFTLGVLMWATPRAPWWLLVIPVTWAFIGTSAAVQLSVPQDYGLALAALGTIILFTRKPSLRAA